MVRIFSVVLVALFLQACGGSSWGSANLEGRFAFDAKAVVGVPPRPATGSTSVLSAFVITDADVTCDQLQGRIPYKARAVVGMLAAKGETVTPGDYTLDTTTEKQVGSSLSATVHLKEATVGFTAIRGLVHIERSDAQGLSGFFDVTSYVEGESVPLFGTFEAPYCDGYDPFGTAASGPQL